MEGGEPEAWRARGCRRGLRRTVSRGRCGPETCSALAFVARPRPVLLGAGDPHVSRALGEFVISPGREGHRVPGGGHAGPAEGALAGHRSRR